MTSITKMLRIRLVLLTATLLCSVTTAQADKDPETASPAQAVAGQGPSVPRPAVPKSGAKKSGPAAFGSALFRGNFVRTRQDGLNPEYIVMPGDRLSIQTWGAVALGGTFVVDSQGNLFLPEIGPIPVAGVRNADLTRVVESAIKRIYVRHVGVYTNLLTARPVAVLVTGGVNQPGAYAGVPSDSVLFFLDQAGGIDPALGTYRRIKILRDGQVFTEIDLYDFVLRGSLQEVQFKDGDTILVERRGPQIELRGHVAAPGLIELNSTTALGSEVLEIVPKSARARTVTLAGMRNLVPFKRTLDISSFASVALADGDVVTLRDDGHTDHILIHIKGEFLGPDTLVVPRGARLIDVLNHVPVNSAISDTSAVYLLRPSIAQAQKDAIDDSLFRLERSALLALSSSNGEADIRVKEAELMQRFADRARLIDPLGRVVTARNGQQKNMLLEDGDTVVIPALNGLIRVSGEIQIAHASAYESGLTAADYIVSAGGYSDRGDDDRVILIHANAEIEVVAPDTQVFPGDEILVPPRIDTKVLQNTVDVTQIIYQVAVAAGVVLSLAL